MTIRVIEPGLQTLIVDAGRPASRSLGVPLGGAADRTSFQIANVFVGNEPNTAAIEFALAGPTLTTDTDLYVAIVGASFDVKCGEVSVRPNRAWTWPAGKTLRIQGARLGCRGYFGIRGGIESEEILGSRSSLEALKRGDELSVNEGRGPGRELGSGLWPALPSPNPSLRGRGIISIPVPLTEELGEGDSILRILPGAHSQLFDSQVFLESSFEVTPSSNRMGLRLKGPALQRTPGELISEPVCPGTVQVVNDGQCIVLGVDGQTIGGYPKIAQVIAADLGLLGQLRPGDRLRFEMVTVEEAERAYWKRTNRLIRMLNKLSTSI